MRHTYWPSHGHRNCLQDLSLYHIPETRSIFWSNCVQTDVWQRCLSISVRGKSATQIPSFDISSFRELEQPTRWVSGLIRSKSATYFIEDPSRQLLRLSSFPVGHSRCRETTLSSERTPHAIKSSKIINTTPESFIRTRALQLELVHMYIAYEAYLYK